MSGCLVSLARVASLDIVRDLRPHVREGELVSYQCDCLGYPWVSMCGIVVMVLNALFDLCRRDLILPMFDRELFFVVP